MANYVLIYTGGAMAVTPAEQEAQMKSWGTWFTKLGANVVDPGNPFVPVVKHVGQGGKAGDGAVGTQASGYSIIKSDSLAAAVESAKECPIVQGGGQISVYEVMPVM